MARKTVFFNLLAGILFYASLCADESITITTYYPSPYGSYNELQLYPHSIPVTTCDSTTEGAMYYDSDDGQVKVCDGAGGWGSIGGGPWSVTGNNIYNTNSGFVGVGTANPGYKLEVIGQIRASSGTPIYSCPSMSACVGTEGWQDTSIAFHTCDGRASFQSTCQSPRSPDGMSCGGPFTYNCTLIGRVVAP